MGTLKPNSVTKGVIILIPSTTSGCVKTPNQHVIIKLQVTLTVPINTTSAKKSKNSGIN
jgi:hypothetical protein